jgi:hypothetical protein
MGFARVDVGRQRSATGSARGEWTSTFNFTDVWPDASHAGTAQRE